MKIVFIGAIWCPSCLLMKSRIRKLIASGASAQLVEYDFDNDLEAIEKYEVGSILPVIVFEQDGIETSRIVGEESLRRLKEVVEGRI
ncbi:MAG: thioredoxin family protein [Bacilli bacterium]|nr:thioredoxin family protein [Bacilli bacterium]MBN2696808.1 thioredoxin family protein [Bacilli bacterium]